MKKYKVGYTTGTFDMFHVGHLNVLKKAKEMCETLVVGVSTDELVLDYKGHLPIISLADRIEIIESIKCVDRVVVQTTLDKVIAWNTYHFEAFFHGDDWKGTDLYNSYEKIFSSIGVDVIYIPYTNRISSSQLRDYICNTHR